MRSTGTSPARGEVSRHERRLACQSLPAGGKPRTWRNKTSIKVLKSKTLFRAGQSHPGLRLGSCVYC
jgi:hypothetical protein